MTAPVEVPKAGSVLEAIGKNLAWCTEKGQKPGFFALGLEAFRRLEEELELPSVPRDVARLVRGLDIRRLSILEANAVVVVTKSFLKGPPLVFGDVRLNDEAIENLRASLGRDHPPKDLEPAP